MLVLLLVLLLVLHTEATAVRLNLQYSVQMASG
jgi:hypothetical protein